jgi:2-polyprenyl-6-hydroxyphenyl methylase/3-demethylubiquinone-9 3-methyltransferase
MRQTIPGANVDPAEVAKLSASAGAWWNAKGPFAPLHRINPVRLAYIREKALEHFARPADKRAPFSGLRLLDVGCGGGLVCEPMARLGFDVTGSDASEVNVGAARAHAEDLGLSIRYRLTGGAERPSEPPFDIVLGLVVIEHTNDPARFVAECAERLAPGGLLILSTLNRTWKSLALGKFAAEYLLRWLPPGSHDWRRFITPGELSALIADIGLDADGPVGVDYDLAAGRWRRSTDIDVNYMMAATKIAPSTDDR